MPVMIIIIHLLFWSKFFINYISIKFSLKNDDKEFKKFVMHESFEFIT